MARYMEIMAHRVGCMLGYCCMRPAQQLHAWPLGYPGTSGSPCRHRFAALCRASTRHPPVLPPAQVGVAFTRFQSRFFQAKYGNLDSAGGGAAWAGGRVGVHWSGKGRGGEPPMAVMTCNARLSVNRLPLLQCPSCFAVISYGPCQTPTLSFCVERHQAIVAFQVTASLRCRPCCKVRTLSCPATVCAAFVLPEILFRTEQPSRATLLMHLQPEPFWVVRPRATKAGHVLNVRQ